MERRWDLFLKEQERLRSYVQRMAPAGCDSGDVVQEVGLRVLLSQPEAIAHEDRFGAWCRAVARHVVLHELRAARYERLKRDSIEVGGHAGSFEPEQRAAVRSTLQRELASVDPVARELLLRRYVLEQTSGEIARDTKLSAAAVRMRLMRARAAIGLLPMEEERPPERRRGRS